MNELQLKKEMLTCPGDTIQEHIDTIGMSQAELAERLGKAPNKLNEIIKGKTPITHETANKLEFVLGVPAYFWLNLERSYQDELNDIKKLEELEKFKNWLSNFPKKILKELNIIPETENIEEQVEYLLKFFRVASPEEWEKVYNEISVSFKISLKPTKKAESISVWLRLGELQADQIKLNTFDKNLLKSNLYIFKEICYKADPNWMQRLQMQCADFGIALVYTPKIPKAPIVGASRWIKNYRVPLIQMTDRNKSYNSFWFGFFHELGHIILHGKKDVFLEGIENISEDTKKEEEENIFAEKCLIGKELNTELKQCVNPNIDHIKYLSNTYKVNESIIAAQIQRNDKIQYKNPILQKIKDLNKFEIIENDFDILKHQIKVI